MAPICLFTGDNAYLLGEERRRWITSFTEKYGAENYSRIDASGLSYPRLLDEIAVLPFTAPKRLVILDGMPNFEREEILRLPADTHSDVILLLICPELDRRRAASKALLEIAEVKNFSSVTGAVLDAWMRQRCSELSLSITPQALRQLHLLVGEDQMMLESEIRKLALYANGRTLDIADVLSLVLPSAEQNVWHLMDILSTGDSVAALRFVRTYLASGASAAGLWPTLLWLVAQLTLASAAFENGAKTEAAIIKQSGLKFGTVRSLLPIVRRMDRSHLLALSEMCAQADIDLKTGPLRMSAEAPQEQEVLIDLCVAKLCKA